VQWFHDLETGLQKLSSLLKPNGRLIFTTLGMHSFCEWRKNLKDLGKPVGLHDYPDLDRLRDFSIPGCRIEVRSEIHIQNYDNGMIFLRALKNIGAQAPQQSYAPMSAGEMRKVIKSLEENSDCSMTYEILLADITRG